MKDTVAVALITSLSTLAAAGMTGLLGTWMARDQMRSQSAIARDQNAEQRASRHEQLRREAYVAFLSKCDQAYRQLDRRWVEVNRKYDGTGYDEVYSALRAVDEAFNLLLLDGSENVAIEAQEVVDSINREHLQQRRLLGGSSGDDRISAALDHQYRTDRLVAIAERTLRRNAFVEAARGSLRI